MNDTSVLRDRRPARRARAPGEAGTPVDAGGLAAALRERTGAEVRFDDGSRALYATDASNYRQVPIGVVVPRTVEDVVVAVETCRAFGAPILGRGGGTSLAGQCCNAGVVFDMSKYLNRVLDIDAERRVARVQPGVVLDDLRRAAAPHGLTFGPDPATHDRCTLGGMIGNNSCGVRSVMAAFAGTGARTADNVESLEVLTYDGVRMRVGRTDDEAYAQLAALPGRAGEIVRGLRALRDGHADLIRRSFPDIPRRVSGYNLPQLLPEHGFDLARALVGSESTCVLVLEATVHLIPAQPARKLLVLGYPDIARAAEDVPMLLEFRPVGLEGMDDRLVEDMRKIDLHPESIAMLPDGRAWLLVEFGGESADEVEERVDEVMDNLRERQALPSQRAFAGEDARRVWEVRESGLAATAHVGTERPTWPGWEDAAVPPDRLGPYLTDFRALLERFGYECALYGHFGQGCVHTRIDFDLFTQEGIARFRSFVTEAADLVVRYGGSCSGEHGDGQARGELLARMYPPAILEAFRAFKALWDPAGKMNPGKVIDANPLDGQLRLGPAFAALPDPPTRLAFPHDGGKFTNVAIRCVGVGKCRKRDAGTMCPSYMVTGEEKHSTRGRARLLFEMVQGDVLKDGWQSEAVREALDLCLACKGCKGECPVHVDMAAYKAEFLSHYFEHHARSRSDYALGWVHRWARVASLAPGLANLATQAPVVGALARSAAGLTRQRPLPPFPQRTFVAAFRARRRRPRPGRPRVMLWPDTFNNHFHPHVLMAGVEVLERAGFDVEIPERDVCCGRPLYYFGMLDEAKRRLDETLATLRPALEAGVPIVGLEPSCMSTFRDELHDFLPEDPLAGRLQDGSGMLTDFLCEHHDRVPWPRPGGRAMLHQHCHRKSTVKGPGDREVLERMGMSVACPDSGCCGLAGPFGYEHDHYPVSMQIGERVLLPAVRGTPEDTWIVSDGFACREQIAHGGGRRALHPVEVLRVALRDEARGGARAAREVPSVPPARVPTPVLLLAGATLLGALAAAAFRTRRPRAPRTD